MLEIAEEAEAAVLRTGATSAANLLSIGDADENSSEARDVILTGAVASDAIDRLTRYRRQHGGQCCRPQLGHQRLHADLWL